VCFASCPLGLRSPPIRKAGRFLSPLPLVVSVCRWVRGCKVDFFSGLSFPLSFFKRYPPQRTALTTSHPFGYIYRPLFLCTQPGDFIVPDPSFGISLHFSSDLFHRIPVDRLRLCKEHLPPIRQGWKSTIPLNFMASGGFHVFSSHPLILPFFGMLFLNIPPALIPGSKRRNYVVLSESSDR